MASIFAALIVGAGLIGAAAAQDCPRGTLDKAYCDRNGDLVADAPTDPKQLVNPSTIIFSYTPVEDPAVYQKVWDGFIKHLGEKSPARKSRSSRCSRMPRSSKAMRSGRLHIAGVNTGGNPIAVNCAGFVPFAMMAAKDGAFGYEMEIIVPADSPIKTPADIKGKKLAFHLADLEFRLQGAVGAARIRIQSRGQARLRAGIFRQARQLGARRRQQGL